MVREVPPVVSARLVSPLVASDIVSRASVACGLMLCGNRRDDWLDGQVVPNIMAVPSQSLTTKDQVSWIARPGRYAVSRKCDGMRHLLIADDEGKPHLLSRSGSLYAYPMTRGTSADGGGKAAVDEVPFLLPPGTVLDGELMWIVIPDGAKQGIFAVFDAIAVGSERLWGLPFEGRMEGLRNLRLVEAEECVEIAGCQPNAAAERGSATSEVAKSNLRKQQAPMLGLDNVLLVAKRHVEVSAQALDQLSSSLPGCPYPCDGLVFTPKEVSYALGLSQLLFKWQSSSQTAADLVGADLEGQADFSSGVSAALVFECYLIGRGINSLWIPSSVRWDKARGNAQQVVEGMRMNIQQLASILPKGYADHSFLFKDLYSETLCSEDPLVSRHPARTIPFPELLGRVMQGVEAGIVERSVDVDSGLEIFNYVGSAEPGDPALSACRGLVLHPARGCVVATPFVRFGDVSQEGSPGWGDGGLGCDVCGCSCHWDEDGERICFCDSCWTTGCDRGFEKNSVEPQEPRPDPARQIWASKFDRMLSPMVQKDSLENLLEAVDQSCCCRRIRPPQV